MLAVLFPQVLSGSTDSSVLPLWALRNLCPGEIMGEIMGEISENIGYKQNILWWFTIGYTLWLFNVAMV